MTALYLIADHVLMRDALRALLEAAGHRVVGEADEPERALAGLRSLAPELVLLDLDLAGHSGLDLLARIQRLGLPLRCIVLTMSAQPRDVVESMRLGAAGYVLKGASALDGLAPRERQIITLGVRGHASAAIGEQLQLSPKTVDTYRSRLMARLGVADLPTLVRLAIREGLISADEDWRRDRRDRREDRVAPIQRPPLP